MNRKRTALYLALIALPGLQACQAQTPKHESTTQKQQSSLRQELEQLIRPYNASVGIALIGVETGDTLSLNDQKHYPMQSVYKFPLALAVLQQVDQGMLSLEQKVHLTKDDLRPTWSPVRDKFPKGNIDLTVHELLTYTVSQSDNNTCDILFRLVGGTAVVQQSLLQSGIRDIKVVATEAEMATAWPVQYSNWARPGAMAVLLRDFYQGKLLSRKSTDLLLHMMTESANSPVRIKGLLPEGITVAHKTGTSDTNKEGLTAATNDVGIITLPNGRHIALAVFVSDTKETKTVNEKIIAGIAKAVFDHYNQ